MFNHTQTHYHKPSIRKYYRRSVPSNDSSFWKKDINVFLRYFAYDYFIQSAIHFVVHQIDICLNMSCGFKYGIPEMLKNIVDKEIKLIYSILKSA